MSGTDSPPNLRRASPPQTIEIKFCPVCGRNDLYTPFTGKSHFSVGERCSGPLVSVLYRVEEPWRT